MRSDTTARAAERSFLGLEMDDGAMTGILPVTEHIRTPDGRLYGGALLGVAIAAMETATERRIVWATTQFVASAPHGTRIDVVAEELARGRRSSQVLVRGTGPDGPMFTALGATGLDRPDYFDTRLPRDAGGTGAAGLSTPAAVHPGGRARIPHRNRHPCGRRGSRCPPAGAADLGLDPGVLRDPSRAGTLVADHLPLTLGRLAGFDGAGASLDNTLRVGPTAEHDWVLLECLRELSAGRYGHGTVHLWAPDGTLLAVGSQSSGMRRMAEWRGAVTPETT